MGRDADLRAVATVLCTDRRGRFLAVRSRDGAWKLPGGRVDQGEPPSRAARREVREEIGLQVEPAEPPAMVWVGTGGQRDKVVFIFGGPQYHRDPAVRLQRSEVSRWKWADAKDAPKLLGGDVGHAVRQALTGRGTYAEVSR